MQSGQRRRDFSIVASGQTFFAPSNPHITLVHVRVLKVRTDQCMHGSARIPLVLGKWPEIHGLTQSSTANI